MHKRLDRAALSYYNTMDDLYPYLCMCPAGSAGGGRGKEPKGSAVTMSKRRAFLTAVLVFLVVLLTAALALAEDDHLKVSMELSNNRFSEPGEEITVSIGVTNVSDEKAPSAVTLYYPNGEQVEEFGAPVLSAGSSKNWSGPWSVTQKELDDAISLMQPQVERILALKRGEIEPSRCGECDCCLRHRKLTGPSLAMDW